MTRSVTHLLHRHSFDIQPLNTDLNADTGSNAMFLYGPDGWSQA
ncbi:hypothetical protein SAMN03159496_03762 [Rhizobium sp. NFR07]|nr:hypothetical protein SAMN03159496_03762 [Rhizobium sp. NFR07]